MITADEFVKQNITSSDKFDFNNKVELVKKFAKLHVEAALKAKVQAMKEHMNEGYSLQEIDAFTEDAYPLTNIK